MSEEFQYNPLIAAAPAAGHLRLVPLGGLGEIGMNMMVYEYGDEIIVIDCGIMFPGEDTPGVDLIIPDTTYLEDRKDKVKAFVITHCHEDHIGALPYILPKFDCPVYGTKLTLGLIQPKLKEHKLLGVLDLQIIKPRDMVQVGEFMLEFIRVTHSTVDCIGIAVHTPIGTIMHTGDFKIDPTPVDDEKTDIFTLSRLGESGVLALLSDSTNVEKEGYTLSERELGDNFEQIFANAKGRIIAATFSSNIHRVQQLIDTAMKYERRVIFAGRSMVSNIRIADELGYMNFPSGIQGTLNDIHTLPDNRILLITTGSQGEAMSALSRIALDDHKHVEIMKGDTVIISARVIPGNEKSIARIINDLYRRGAEVIYERVSEVHVSGHASQEEQKLMLNLVKPKMFIPIHGEYRHLVRHAQLAIKCGVDPDRVQVIENGDVVELTADTLDVIGHTSSGRVFVDGKGVGDVEDEVIRDRRHLAEDGFCIVTVALNRHTGEVISPPEVTTRGFIVEEAFAELIAQAEQSAKDTLETIEPAIRKDNSALQEALSRAVKKYLFKQTNRRPMVLTNIIEL